MRISGQPKSNFRKSEEVHRAMSELSGMNWEDWEKEVFNYRATAPCGFFGGNSRSDLESPCNATQSTRSSETSGAELKERRTQQAELAVQVAKQAVVIAQENLRKTISSRANSLGLPQVDLLVLDWNSFLRPGMMCPTGMPMPETPGMLPLATPRVSSESTLPELTLPESINPYSVFSPRSPTTSETSSNQNGGPKELEPQRSDELGTFELVKKLPGNMTLYKCAEHEGVFRICWRIDGKRLKSADKVAASPTFAVDNLAEGLRWKICVYPLQTETSKDLGSVSFKNSDGQGRLVLKCDTDASAYLKKGKDLDMKFQTLADATAYLKKHDGKNMKFQTRFFAAQCVQRGPVLTDFAEVSNAELPNTEGNWDLSKFIKRGMVTVGVEICTKENCPLAWNLAKMAKPEDASTALPRYQ